jgi:2-oxoisovalerate dehydrogenase E1 component
MYLYRPFTPKPKMDTSLTTPAQKIDTAKFEWLYKKLVTPRLIEEKMLILLRQGRISKWFSGYGQEALSVGTALAMHDDEYILTMHRNLGVFTARNVPLNNLFSQFQGKMAGFTKGRDRSFHFGSQAHKIVGMISHLGQQLGVADGIALANKLQENGKATLVYTGDGGASEGDFHEALNVAAVWKLPVIFVVENNYWGLSTPREEQFVFDSFVQKGPAYGIEAHSIDGNNILEVFGKTSELAESIRQNPRPIILECITFRMRGHEEASGTKYYPPGLIEKWAEKDPVKNYEAWLVANQVCTEEQLANIQKEIKTHIAESVEWADQQPIIMFDAQTELADVYAPFAYEEILPSTEKNAQKRLLDAITDAMRESLERHPNLVLMGQDIAEYGGAFKATDGFVQQFGKGRVRNTPLCESAILGAGLGLSINGYKAIVEMQFADFVTEGFTQIINNLAKSHYRWGQHADVVVRMPTGAGVAAGPFHSQSNEAWFTHTPGLKVVYPAFPYDAKGLLNTAINDPNPVLFFEHKALYRSIHQDIPDDYYTLPFGVASVLNEGADLSIITYGQGVHWALNYLHLHPEIKADLLDLRTLVPLDVEAIYRSVRKTGRAIVLTEDCLFGSIASDISALITENCFAHLDAPVMRVGSLNMPVPFAAGLEKGFLPVDRFAEAVEKLCTY